MLVEVVGVLAVDGNTTNFILGIDPGRAKCGLALLDVSGNCVTRFVTPREKLGHNVLRLFQRYPFETVVLGDRTGSADAMHELHATFAATPQAKHVVVQFVPEHRSSEEGRQLYLLAHRKGWRRLVPIGLQCPPEPFDDYTAEVIARRYLSNLKSV
jgi:RNase H-fold protein (predicted Holliday junction resolvase)